MIYRTILPLLAGASIVALAMPAAAQTAPAADPAAQPQDDYAGDIIVTATKRAVRLQDVPQSITVQTGAELERQQVNTVADLTRIAPSLEIQQAPGQSVGGGGQIRGIGTQSFQQGAVGSVGIVVDGVSQGNANIGDLFDIARVEVLKGPQGTLFGLTTSAGVINITTTAPEFDKITFRARTELSSAGTAGSEYGRQLVQGVINLPLASNAALRVAGNLNLTQGVDRNTLTGRYDPHRSYGGRARFRWEPTDRLSVNVIGDYTKVNDSGVDFFTLYRGDGAFIPAGNPAFPPGTTSLNAAAASCGVVAGASNRNYCSTTPGYTRSETYGGSVQVDYRADPFTVSSISSYRRQNATGLLNIFRLDPLLSKITLPPVPGQIIDGPKPYRSSLFTQELRFASPSGSTVEYTAGLFFSTLNQRNDPEAVSITIPIPFAPPVGVFVPGNNSRVSDDSMAVFGQATIRLAPGLRAIVGGRYTVERLGVDLTPIGATAPTSRPKSNVENLSWRGGLQYTVNKDVMFYATVARGYKGPQIALGDPTNPASVPTIIRAEIPTNYEGGLKVNLLAGKLGFDLSGFYINLKDYQGQQCSPAVGGGLNCLPQNITGVKSRGVEFNLFGRPSKQLSVNLGAIWNKVTYPAGFLGQDGSALGNLQLQSAPEWKFTATGEFTQPIGSAEFFLAADALYKSSLRLAASTNPNVIFDGHVTIGGRVGVRGEDGKWSLGIFARNLTQTREPVVRFLNFPDGTNGVGQILTAQSFRQIGLQGEIRF